jgi:hypothetical protein
MEEKGKHGDGSGASSLLLKIRNLSRISKTKKEIRNL